VAREAAERHTIGNHTWTHPCLRTLTDDWIRTELRRTTAAMTGAGAPTPVLCRPPYGETDARIDGLAREQGMTQVQWDVMSGDDTPEFPAGSRRPRPAAGS
jgi:peptidoglycan/xylan/chitin deacetylase (PgdA/CDA1 family)